MKFDGFPGEKTILSYKLANGVGWLTTHRLIIQKETHNPRLNIMERQDPEMYLLRDFEKAEIKGETLTARFKGGQKAKIRLQFYSPALLQEVKNYIEEAAKYEDASEEEETCGQSTVISSNLILLLFFALISSSCGWLGINFYTISLNRLSCEIVCQIGKAKALMLFILTTQFRLKPTPQCI